MVENKELQTPFYRVKEKDLLFDIALLKRALEENWGNYAMGYSVKTNSLPWLLSYLRTKGFYAEVVSEMEYDLAVRLGYSDNRIIYNSPIKKKEIWEKILLNGGYINLDSSQELDWLEELSQKYPTKRFHIGIRVNCDLKSICPKEELAEGEGGRFGYCYENGVLEQVIKRVSEKGNIKISGLHLHSSTKSRTVQVYGSLAEMAVKIAKEFRLDLEFVDMGGGYFGGRDDMPNYLDYFKVIGGELRKFFSSEKTKLIVEPGVSLISRAITFETSVLDIKDIRGCKYIVTDGSRINLNPLVTRHFYPHHFQLCQKEKRKNEKSQWVCGNTCMEYDRLFEIKDGVELKVGDRIIYDTAGGYTMCLTPLFIYYFPRVWIEKENGQLFLAREEWSNEEYLQKYYWEK